MLGWTEAEFRLFDGGIYCNGACEKLHGQTHYIFLPAPLVTRCVQTVNPIPALHLALQLQEERHAFNHPLAAVLMGSGESPRSPLSRWKLRLSVRPLKS